LPTNVIIFQAEKTSEFFAGKFDIVIVTHCPNKEVLLEVNKICRQAGIKFFSGDIFGFFGYAFMDLIDHDYVEEQTKVLIILL
jgi:ubiquitin-like 1-activating enzyme E1 A